MPKVDFTMTVRVKQHWPHVLLACRWAAVGYLRASVAIGERRWRPLLTVAFLKVGPWFRFYSTDPRITMDWTPAR